MLELRPACFNFLPVDSSVPEFQEFGRCGRRNKSLVSESLRDAFEAQL
jgi:hypothetical protein